MIKFCRYEHIQITQTKANFQLSWLCQSFFRRVYNAAKEYHLLGSLHTPPV